jgi:membrane-bound metal-dependent hydrolase YbcI (DUF457 family)
MAQAGIHGLVGVAVRRWVPARQGLVLGIVLGSFLPDFDNFAVGVATVTGASTQGLHRTLTHSLFFALGVVLIFQLVAVGAKRPSYGNLGLGLGLGVLLHIVLDLLVWFNGVHLLWPLDIYVNLWEGITPPEWFSNLLMPLENLFFAAYFWGLMVLAQRQGTDLDRWGDKDVDGRSAFALRRVCGAGVYAGPRLPDDLRRSLPAVAGAGGRAHHSPAANN